MSLNITGFIRSLLPSISKSDLESDLETSIESIPSIVESFQSLQEIHKVAKPQSEAVKKLIKEFYKELDATPHKVKFSPTKNYAADNVTAFNNVKTNAKYILDELSDALNDVIVSQALTAYKANLIRSVAHIYFLTRYSYDVINYIYVMEYEESKVEVNREYGLNDKQKQFISKNAWLYSRLLAIYGDEHDNFKSKLEKIEEITLPVSQLDEVVSNYDAVKLDISNNLPNGFIGSPIYSIRLVFAQWEADRYKTMKDKKKLLELRYLHLRLMKEQGHTDLQMEKEISYLQSRITTMDKELQSIDKSLEG